MNDQQSAYQKDPGSSLDKEKYQEDVRNSTPEPPPSNDRDREEVSRAESIDGDSKFSPTRFFYIQGHTIWSNEIVIVDITGAVPVAYVGGEVTDEFRDAAKKAGEDQSAAKAFIFEKKHWYSKQFKIFAGGDTKSKDSLADWKHPLFSVGTAQISFPGASKHSTHEIAISPPHWTLRRNEFIKDSIPFEWKCDSKLKSNRMALSKTIGGTKSIIAKYTQRWAMWGAGGVLLIDTREIDDLVAVITAVSMLRRMEQRRCERSPG